MSIAESKKDTMQAELIDLRNKVFFFYFIINAIFVTVVYVLTQVNSQQNTLSIPLPCSVGETQGKIEPISIAFTLVFGILLLIQFFGMLIHRISTISHIMATTKIFGRKLDTKVPMKKIEKPTKMQDEDVAFEMPELTRTSIHVDSLRTKLTVQRIYGEKRHNTRTLKDLKSKINELETIEENSDEQILSQYSNVYVPRASIVNPVRKAMRDRNGSQAGPSSA